jgi:hypothetical protein
VGNSSTLNNEQLEERGHKMATNVESARRATGRGERARDGVFLRLATETKQAFKTTEFWGMVAVIAGILIASWVVNDNGDRVSDAFPAVRAWLYVAIVASAYIVSRGLAKAGSSEPYWSEPEDLPGGQRNDS